MTFLRSSPTVARATTRIATILLAAFLPAAATCATIAHATEDDALSGATCSLLFRAIDDQADRDVRGANQRIWQIRRQIEIAAIGTPHTIALGAELVAAQAERTDILEKQHLALNTARRRCDILRDAERKAPDA